MKKHIKTMDVVLVFVGIALVAFTVYMIWLFYNIGSVPDILVTCVFAALGTECGIMGWIKNTKERNKQREWDIEDREREEHERENDLGSSEE